jgi:2'-5' RNA ligase
VRTFIAIELPEEIKAAIAALQAELRRARAEVSWTKPENLHLTLKFLGEIEEQRIGQIESACIETAAAAAPFTLSLTGAGVFPHASRPRVLWVGLAGEVEKVKLLQSDLDERLARAGFEREARAFQPHLTAGRIKSPKGAPALVSRAQAYRLPALSFTVREVVVMRSQLHPAGARYTPLARAKFKDEG